MEKIKEFESRISSIKKEIAVLLLDLKIKTEINVDVFLNFDILDFCDFSIVNAPGLRLLGTENFINLYYIKKLKTKNEKNEEIIVEEEIPTKTNTRIPIWYFGRAKLTNKKIFYTRDKFITEIENAVKLQGLFHLYKNLRNEIEVFYMNEFSYFIACEHLETSGDNYFDILKKNGHNYDSYIKFRDFKNELKEKDIILKENRNILLSKKILEKNSK